MDRNVAKARQKDSLRAAFRLARLVEGRPRFISDPPLIVPIEELLPPGERTALENRVGTRAWIVQDGHVNGLVCA